LNFFWPLLINKFTLQDTAILKVSWSFKTLNYTKRSLGLKWYFQSWTWTLNRINKGLLMHLKFKTQPQQMWKSISLNWIVCWQTTFTICGCLFCLSRTKKIFSILVVLAKDFCYFWQISNSKKSDFKMWRTKKSWLVM